MGCVNAEALHFCVWMQLLVMVVECDKLLPFLFPFPSHLPIPPRIVVICAAAFGFAHAIETNRI